MERTSTLPARRFVVLLAGIGAAFALGYAFINPAFESPDETAHVHYISFIARTGHLANLNDRTQVEARGEGHQHPLFYVLAAGVVRLCTGDGVMTVAPQPNPLFYGAGGTKFLHTSAEFPRSSERVAFYTLRCLGALCVGLLVWLVGDLALRFVGTPFGLLAPGVVAGLPQLQYIGGSVSNDALAALLGTAALVAALRARENGKWWLAGLALSAACLAKKSGLVSGVPLLLVLFPFDRRLGRRLAGLALGLIPLAVWFVRQQLVYGSILGGSSEVLSRPDLVTPKSLGAPYFSHAFLDLTYQSFFARFGWMQVAFDPRLVFACCVPFLPGLLGVLAVRRSGERALPLLCAAVWVLNVAGLVHYNLTFTQPQGRLLFPALGPLAVLVALGWREVGRTLAPRWQSRGVAAALLLLVGCDVAVGVAYHGFNVRSEARVRAAIAAGTIPVPPANARPR